MKSNLKQRPCGNPDCEHTFIRYNSLIKYCSANCKTAMEGRKKIARLSIKRQAQNDAYLLLRQAYLQRNPICEVATEMCTITATDIHHKAGRTEDKLTDRRYFLATCRICHRQIEEHPIWAKEQGFSLNRLDK